MKTLKIIALRVWIGLLRIERSMRLDAMQTTYAASPERLTAEFVREVLADVDTDIERAHARIETMKEERREPGASPVWPVWLLAGWLVLMVLLALSGCGQAVALDSTDNRVTLQRSGLAVYTDHG
ncbi:hypothetical protein, partial [Ensifer sp. SSB1]|uniref:hypothetical protein n=1 Tax=Ensifer sp. SSB1 TaxID=2795385 RepID=UPI001A5E181F